MATSNNGIISQSLANKMLYCIKEYLKEVFFYDALYDNIDDLKKELLDFLVYYNEHRPHTSLENLTPKEFIENEKKCK